MKAYVTYIRHLTPLHGVRTMSHAHLTWRKLKGANWAPKIGGGGEGGGRKLKGANFDGSKVY